MGHDFTIYIPIMIFVHRTEDKSKVYKNLLDVEDLTAKDSSKYTNAGATPINLDLANLVKGIVDGAVVANTVKPLSAHGDLVLRVRVLKIKDGC